MRKLLFLISVISLFTASCDFGQDTPDEPSGLVVEGWIEDGGFPVVLLTRSMPVNDEYLDPDTLSDYLVKWAKVSVTDGDDTVVLTGKYDKGYFPPFIYTTSRMRGKANHTYTLIVEYGNLCATATTTIPSKPLNSSFTVERCSNSDTLYQIIAHFRDDPSVKNYYQFFSRVGTASKQYLASYLGSIDDAVLGSSTDVPVYRGHRFAIEDYTPYYKLTDTVSVKFSQVDEQSYRFWDEYTKTLSLSGNMFLSSNANLTSNVNGAIGYWCGLASITNHIVIADSIH